MLFTLVNTGRSNYVVVSGRTDELILGVSFPNMTRTMTGTLDWIANKYGDSKETDNKKNAIRAIMGLEVSWILNDVWSYNLQVDPAVIDNLNFTYDAHVIDCSQGPATRQLCDKFYRVDFDPSVAKSDYALQLESILRTRNKRDTDCKNLIPCFYEKKIGNNYAIINTISVDCLKVCNSARGKQVGIFDPVMQEVNISGGMTLNCTNLPISSVCNGSCSCEFAIRTDLLIKNLHIRHKRNPVASIGRALLGIVKGISRSPKRAYHFIKKYPGTSFLNIGNLGLYGYTGYSIYKDYMDPSYVDMVNAI